MNNKGQSLVTFVLIMPVVFLIMVLVYNVGSMILLKNELNDINHIVINYGLDNITDEDIINKMIMLVKKNKDSINNISVNIKDNKIYIILEDSIDTLIDFDGLFRVKSSYVGYMDENKKIIERN